MASPVQPEEVAAVTVDIPIDSSDEEEETTTTTTNATQRVPQAAEPPQQQATTTTPTTPTPTTPATPAAPPKELIVPISYWDYFFRFTDTWDLWYMALGTFGAIATGALIPFFQMLFGRMLDSLNSGTNIVEAVSHVALQFAYMACVAFVCAGLQVYAWGLYGERTVARIRGAYVKAILRQEIAWFDMQTRGETATIVNDLTTQLQDGKGRKNGDTIEYITQVRPPAYSFA